MGVARGAGQGGMSMGQGDAISRSAVLEKLSLEFDLAAEERADTDDEKEMAFNSGEMNCARRVR